MAIVSLMMADESYGSNYDEALYKNDGTTNLDGINFGDIETGVEYPPRFVYLRHDGINPIYNVAYYLRTLGVDWGGYVSSEDDATDPYNPNWFRSGGVNPDTNLPNSSTADYELMRTVAVNNAEMGLRVHYNREDEANRTYGLGYDSVGLNFNPIKLQSDSVDYGAADTDERPVKTGYIYPEPEDDSKQGKSGDEAKLGLSIKLPEDIIGSGHIQFSFAIKYRYTI